tara:strand:- start:175 stop:573 length:399 start_codon:yes stop_codon:yes gene_type:complete
MSDNNQGLPDVGEAYNNLFEGVHANIFFGKLAQAGIQPQNEKEAADLIELAEKLRGVNDNEKQAGDSRFSGPVNALGAVIGETPQGQQAQAIEEAQSIKAAAAELAKEPVFYNSVLALKAHEAAIHANNQEG